MFEYDVIFRQISVSLKMSSINIFQNKISYRMSYYNGYFKILQKLNF